MRYLDAVTADWIEYNGHRFHGRIPQIFFREVHDADALEVRLVLEPVPGCTPFKSNPPGHPPHMVGPADTLTVNKRIDGEVFAVYQRRWKHGHHGLTVLLRATYEELASAAGATTSKPHPLFHHLGP
jgi:hypothetical protein